jgi:hypothetical protein
MSRFARPTDFARYHSPFCVLNVHCTTNFSAQRCRSEAGEDEGIFRRAGAENNENIIAFRRDFRSSVDEGKRHTHRPLSLAPRATENLKCVETKAQPRRLIVVSALFDLPAQILLFSLHNPPRLVDHSVRCASRPTRPRRSILPIPERWGLALNPTSIDPAMRRAWLGAGGLSSHKQIGTTYEH